MRPHAASSGRQCRSPVIGSCRRARQWWRRHPSRSHALTGSPSPLKPAARIGRCPHAVVPGSVFPVAIPRTPSPGWDRAVSRKLARRISILQNACSVRSQVQHLFVLLRPRAANNSVLPLHREASPNSAAARQTGCAERKWIMWSGIGWRGRGGAYHGPWSERRRGVSALPGIKGAQVSVWHARDNSARCTAGQAHHRT